jgi:DNA-directed RNA polymerase specialized sigma24 family protein
MTPVHLSSLLRQLQRTADTAAVAELSDSELLHRFAGHQDEHAFTALVRRHEAMVLGVRWRLLHHAQDAQDAFQATFLVLARKARSVRWHDSIGSWLHSVAYRLAARTRAAAARRQVVERQVRNPAETRAVPAWQVSSFTLLPQPGVLLKRLPVLPTLPPLERLPGLPLAVLPPSGYR